MKKGLYLLLCATIIASCTRTNPPYLPSEDGDHTDMRVLPPYAEPTLDWSLNYKGLLNAMAQRGFVSTRVTEDRLYYTYSTPYEQVETAVLSIDTARCYRGAEVTVTASTVSRADVALYLGQEYTETGRTEYPSPEIFYCSKKREDSIRVSLRTEGGRPVVTYTKY